MTIKEKHGDGDWGWSQGSRGQLHEDDGMTHDELRNATNEAGCSRRLDPSLCFAFWHLRHLRCPPTPT